MGFKVITRQLNGIILIEPDVYGDERGFFMESYRSDHFEQLGINSIFIQDNHSRSGFGILRGLHFQWDKPMGKLIRVTIGKAYIVEVDLRHNSPTLGKWWSTELSSENKRMLWVPPGFANGFLSLSEACEMQYKCTAVWNKNGESAIRWNDPAIGIDWPVDSPVMSDKDRNARTLEDWLKQSESKEFSI